VTRCRRPGADGTNRDDVVAGCELTEPSRKAPEGSVQRAGDRPGLELVGLAHVEDDDLFAVIELRE